MSDPRPALEGLDALPWAAFSHARGSAEQTPAQLRGLLSHDADARAAALATLEAMLLDDLGWGNEVSVAALPFLFEVARWRSLPSRVEVLELLVRVMSVEHFNVRSMGAKGEADEELLRAKHAGILIGELPTLIALLREDDPRVLRQGLRGLWALHYLEVPKAAVTEELLTVLRRLGVGHDHGTGHPDDELRASSLIALAAFGGDAVAEELVATFTRETSSSLRFAVAAGFWVHCAEAQSPELGSLIGQGMRGELGEVIRETHELPFGVRPVALRQAVHRRTPELFAGPRLGEWRSLNALGRRHWIELSFTRSCLGLYRSKASGEHQRVELDGRDITDMASLLCAFGEAINGPGGYGGDSLQGFDDVLFGGAGLEVPCTIVWHHTDASRAGLDAGALAAWCREKLHEIAEEEDEELFEEGTLWLENTLAAAERGERSLFDVVVEGIRSVPERADCRHQLKLELR